jgi:sugar-specific transcriptional regulator TrmB
MSEQTDNYINLLKPFGLSNNEANIYLYLLQKSYTTALQISKVLNISRTKVYRLLDKLQEKQLVQFKLDDRGMKFGATNPEKLTQIIIEKQQEIEKLKKTLPSLLPHLNNLTSQVSNKNSKVLYYKGIKGLKQVSWNALKANKILRVFEVEHISDFLPLEFAENFRKEQVKKKITTRDLTNKNKRKAFTKITELIQNYNQFRYISPDKLKINFETLIYNNIYATYTYKDNEVFCVEIYNQNLADMQKQLFDFIWNNAQPMIYTDKFGTAKLDK